MKQLRDNRIKFYLLCISIALLCFHFYQFYDSGYQVYPLIRIIGFSAIIINLIFFDEKFIPYLIYIFALAIAQTISFENYTPFVMILVTYTMLKKWLPCMMSVYLIDIIIVCTRHAKSPIHLIIHVLNCAILFILYQIAMGAVMKNKRLDLTPDEDFILDQIVNKGKLLKEIDGYKQNTVSKKLKQMRIKNYCQTNKELYKRYKINKSSTN